MKKKRFSILDIKAPDFEPPAGWQRYSGKAAGSIYNKKNMRLVATEIHGEIMVSISKQRRGRPGQPTVAQCREVLDAFCLAGLEEVPRTMSARYFKPSKDGAS